MIKFITGNIFTSKCKVLVNPTNTIGPMGAGLAKQFSERDLYLESKYKSLCKRGLIKPGILWLYNMSSINKVCLCFPTKNHFKDKSKIEYIDLGLSKFVSSYREKSIDSIAFPLLGCGLGGLNESDVLPVMVSYLKELPINIEIYK